MQNHLLLHILYRYHLHAKKASVQLVLTTFALESIAKYCIQSLQCTAIQVTDNKLSKTLTIIILLVALGTSGGEGFKTLVPNYPFSSQSRVRGLCSIKIVTFETWMADFVKRQYKSRFSYLPINFCYAYNLLFLSFKFILYFFLF